MATIIEHDGQRSPAVELTRPMLPSGTETHLLGDPRRRTVAEEQRAAATWWLAVLLIAGLGLRLMIFALGPMGDLSLAVDAQSARYVALSEHLVDEGAFALTAAQDDGLAGRVNQLRDDAGELDVAINGELRPELYRTPGYPTFLALFEWAGLPPQLVLVTQCLLGAVCIWLVYRVTLALLDSPSAGLLAAAVMALHPAAVAVTNVMLPDALWLTLLLAGLWLIVSCDENPTVSLAIGGFLMGVAALVQPYALVLLTLLAMWVVLRHRKLATLAGAVVMLVAAAAPVGAWMGRNYAMGYGAQLSSGPVIDRYFHTVADMRRAEDAPADFTTLTDELMKQRGENEGVLAAMDRLGGEAIDLNPWLYGNALKENAIHVFTDHSLGSLYRQLGMAYQPPAALHQATNGQWTWEWLASMDDGATVLVALGWLALNTLLVIAAVAGLVAMTMRGKWFSALLLVVLIVFAVAGLHSRVYGRPQALALAFEAVLIGGVLVAGRPRKLKPKKTRRQKQLEKQRRQQQQSIGVDHGVDEIEDNHDPIIPGRGPREGARPI